MRMFVDKDNPLFMFRNVSNGKTVWESALDTYNAIPEDVRNFSAIYVDHLTWEFTKEEQISFWEEYLTFTDKHNVPTVLQIECFCTNGTRDGFTTEELTSIFKKHNSLIGFVQVELCTSGVSKTNKATEISLSGFKEKPQVNATGTNNAKLKTCFNPNTGTLTLTVVSNGKVIINIK